jgi:NAD(P)H dehydrogenase (quinone)
VKWFLFLLGATVYAQQPPTRILIAYYSETGNTEKIAQAIQKGAAGVAGVEATLRKTADVKDEEILRTDGLIVGTPVQWANAATEARKFVDRAGAVLWNAKTSGDGRTAGAFCTGGGVAMGKDIARLSILSAFLTMKFTVIGGEDDQGFGTLGPEATTGPTDPGLSDRELDEARRFGERFAKLTRQLKRGK